MMMYGFFEFAPPYKIPDEYHEEEVWQPGTCLDSCTRHEMGKPGQMPSSYG